MVARLRSQSSQDLLRGLLDLHQRRVAVHKAYDAAFRKALTRGPSIVKVAYLRYPLLWRSCSLDSLFFGNSLFSGPSSLYVFIILSGRSLVVPL